jgi:hypothetical protein
MTPGLAGLRGGRLGWDVSGAVGVEFGWDEGPFSTLCESIHNLANYI